MKEGEPLVRHSRQTLHSLDLILNWYNNINNTFHSHISKSQTIKLEMKEVEPFVRHSRQTLHSKNLNLEWYKQHRHSFFTFRVTGNEIGAEGGRAIGEALKTNTSLTRLNLLVILHHQHFSYFTFRVTGNEIEAEGGRAICEALKTNTSLTKLNLELIQQHQHFSFLYFKSQAMELEMKSTLKLNWFLTSGMSMINCIYHILQLMILCVKLLRTKSSHVPQLKRSIFPVNCAHKRESKSNQCSFIRQQNRFIWSKYHLRGS